MSEKNKQTNNKAKKDQKQKKILYDHNCNTTDHISAPWGLNEVWTTIQYILKGNLNLWPCNQKLVHYIVHCIYLSKYIFYTFHCYRLELPKFNNFNANSLETAHSKAFILKSKYQRKLCSKWHGISQGLLLGNPSIIHECMICYKWKHVCMFMNFVLQ